MANRSDALISAVSADKPLATIANYEPGKDEPATDTRVGAAPIDILLFCPNCAEQHVDEPKPDVCQTCGKGESECACVNYTAWLNPPHKSHRCNFCNYVWRPADVPTNGVAAIRTKGERDEEAKPREAVAWEVGRSYEKKCAAHEQQLADQQRELDELEEEICTHRVESADARRVADEAEQQLATKDTAIAEAIKQRDEWMDLCKKAEAGLAEAKEAFRSDLPKIIRAGDEAEARAKKAEAEAAKLRGALEAVKAWFETDSGPLAQRWHGAEISCVGMYKIILAALEAPEAAPVTTLRDGDELRSLLTDVAQIFDGWHGDGTAWTEWDESVRRRISQTLKQLSEAPEAAGEVGG